MKVYSPASAEFPRGRLAVLVPVVSFNKHRRLGGSGRNFSPMFLGLVNLR